MSLFFAQQILMMMRDCRLSLSIIGPPICNVTKTNINLIVTNSLRTHPAVILMKGLTFKLIVQIKMIPTIIFFNLNINKMIGYILFGTIHYCRVSSIQYIWIRFQIQKCSIMCCKKHIDRFMKHFHGTIAFNS